MPSRCERVLAVSLGPLCVSCKSDPLVSQGKPLGVSICSQGGCERFFQIHPVCCCPSERDRLAGSDLFTGSPSGSRAHLSFLRWKS